MDKQTESRSAFEAWWGKVMNTQEMDLQWSDNWQTYSCHETNRAWLAWEASRESLVVELPKPTCTYADHSYPAYSQKQVEKMLVDCGIRIKGEGDES